MPPSDQKIKPLKTAKPTVQNSKPMQQNLQRKSTVIQNSVHQSNAPYEDTANNNGNETLKQWKGIFQPHSNSNGTESQ